MRGVYDKKGEQFAYLLGDKLFTLDDEPTGYVRGEFVVDLQGGKIWRVVGDGLYSLDSSETIGFMGTESPNYNDF